MTELIIGLIIGFLLATYTFNEKARSWVNKLLTKGKEKPKAKGKTKGGKA